MDVGLLFSALTAAGTIGAVAVALYLGLRQQRANTEALRDSHRPILSPTEAVFRRDFLASDDPSYETSDFDHTARANAFTLRNVGPGVALNVDGILMAPQQRVAILQRSHRLNLSVPFFSGDQQWVRAEEGKSMLGARDEILPGWSLCAPDDPGSTRLRGVEAISVRLTLTCSDIHGRVHAFIYDYAENHRWVYRTSGIAKQSIEGLNHEAIDQRLPKPPAAVEPVRRFVSAPKDDE